MYTAIPVLKDHQQALSSFDGYCIAYFRHEVLVGQWTQGNADFVHAPQWDKLQELHIFNALHEYRIVRLGDGSFRLRIRDDEKESSEFFDESILIIGNLATQTTGERFFISSEKGRFITLPTQLAQKTVVIRNYLSFESPDLHNIPGCEIMRITDWRFVGFADEMTCSTMDKEV